MVVWAMDMLGDDVETHGARTDPDDASGPPVVSESGGAKRHAHDNVACCAPPDGPSAVFPEEGY